MASLLFFVRSDAVSLRYGVSRTVAIYLVVFLCLVVAEIPTNPPPHPRHPPQAKHILLVCERLAKAEDGRQAGAIPNTVKGAHEQCLAEVLIAYSARAS